MRELLAAVKTQLQTGLDYVRDRDVNVVPSEGFIPAGVRFPCVGLKDGGLTRTELAGGMWEVVLTVKLVVYVQLLKEEASIMGDSAAGRKGVLEIAEDIHAALDENLLGINGMIEAFSPNEGESELFGDDSELLQRKVITYQYVKQEDRP